MLQENRKKLLIIPILGIGILGLVAFSPSIYAGAIEPHITIFMDLGQQTNPFVIKDDSNDDVFSIDTTGKIFPEQNTIVEFSYQSPLNQIIIPNVEYDVLFQFDVVPNTVSTVWEVVTRESFLYGEYRRVSGTGSCGMFTQYEDSANPGVWFTTGGESWTGTSSGWNYGWGSRDWNSWGDEPTGFRAVLYEEVGTACEFRNLTAIYEMPDNQIVSFTRVI